MALQFIYSSWKENNTEISLTASSVGMSDDDLKYILNNAEICQTERPLSEDDTDWENENHANVMYLITPSGKRALLRAGFYTVNNSEQVDNYIVHSYIAEENEDFFPMLYVINNCFKNELSLTEQAELKNNPVLKNSAFPKAQFKLSQQEINKFFSPARKKTLSNLLQSVIDSYDNNRIIILNDRFSTLKYWFFGLYCCLPKTIRQQITYASYSLEVNRNVKLTCGAYINTIDNETEIEEGNFVIDNTGAETCTDIDSAKYAQTIISIFTEDYTVAVEKVAKIEEIMLTYEQTISAAAGIHSILNNDFAWFDSIYDLKYFLGKLCKWDEIHLEEISQNLWEKILSPGFKFEIDENILPVLSFIFRYTSEKTKKEIFSFINQNKGLFGINEALALKDYAEEFKDKLGFIWEYLPSSLIEKEAFEEYVDAFAIYTNEISLLLYIIADKFNHLSEQHGITVIYSKCRYAFIQLIKNNDFDNIINLCRKFETVSEEFILNVVIGAFVSLKTHLGYSFISLGDDFMFPIIEELLTYPESVFYIIAEYAKNGCYSEGTLDHYISLSTKYPDEISKINSLLSDSGEYDDFLNEIKKIEFSFDENVTREDLVHFMQNFCLSERQNKHSFENRLISYLDSLIPVQRIDEAIFFINCLAKKNIFGNKIRLFDELCDYIVKQSTVDLFDYFGADITRINSTEKILLQYNKLFSKEFYSVKTGLLFREAVVSQNKDAYALALMEARSSSPFSKFLDSPEIFNQFSELFSKYILLFLIEADKNETDSTDISYKILTSFFENSDFCSIINEFYSDAKNQENLLRLSKILLVFHIKTTGRYSALEKQLNLFLLNSRDLKIRKSSFRKIASLCRFEEERNVVQNHLTKIYPENLSFFKRRSAKKEKHLF